MTWILFLCFAFADASHTSYDPTEVFEPIRREEMTLGANGEVYILDFDSKTVLHFDAKGKKLASFGGAGNGPAEFVFPRLLAFENDTLYVVDQGHNRVVSFDRTGKYLKSEALPDNVRNIVKIQNGWVYDHSRLMHDPGEIPRVSIHIADNSFQDSKELFSFEQGEGARGIQVEITGNQKPTVRFNPVAVRSGMAASSNGAHAFIQLPEGFEIRVIDAKTRSVIQTISRKEEGIPFNEEYGQAQVDDLAEKARKRHSPVIFEGKFPERFPAIRAIFPTAEANLGIQRWTAKPDEIERISVLDTKGSEVTLPYKPEHALRVFAIYEGHAYINCYDEELDAHIVRVPLNKVDAYIESHPMEMATQRRVFFQTSEG